MLHHTAPDIDRSPWDDMVARVANDGSMRHPHLQRLLAPHPVARDLSDAVHAFCAVHGGCPGSADCALERNRQPQAEAWLAACAAAMADERAYLARLTSAAGPLPSTPGQAETDAVLVHQRHSLGALSGSERIGCSTGGIVALNLDWFAIRRVLDVAAIRFGVAPPPLTLPPASAVATVVAAATTAIGPARALAFGAGQLLAQHRGLWDLLEARTSARASD